MGGALDKDGWLTTLVEAIPFGGVITAPIHALAGNDKEAIRALAVGLGSGLPFLLDDIEKKKAPMVGILTVVGVEIPFTYVNSEEHPKSLPAARCARHINKKATHFISYSPLMFVNRWGFSLFADDSGVISHHNRNRVRNDWEGWVLEYTGGDNLFLSRSRGNGKYVLSISDGGEVRMTTERMKGGCEEFEMRGYEKEGVVTLRRVKEPRFYLSCSNEGQICATKDCYLEGWEAWTMQ